MKTQTIVVQFISIIVSLSLNGCHSIYYAPNAQNVPIFKEKNEARISAAYSIADDATGYNPIQGFDIQGAFAAGKHFAIIANSFMAESNEDDELYASGIRHQNTMLNEVGAGYFKFFPEKKLTVETYGGMGLGNFKNHHVSKSDPLRILYSSVNFKRYFIQPSIGRSLRHFALAFSLRMSLLTYDQKPAIDLGTSYFLVEPCFTIRGGWKGFKFQTQIQLSNNLTDVDFPQHHISFNTGICITLPVKKSIQ
ncbi:MAG TPA: hypothetical protein PLJ60_00120 [Chryseolinea sp.]|nr:hypothetical protein [Chryseolinea sp.]HPH45357.1 hypothetical protein [Chryseolinea sp.]HPM28710.1 hypothetical protein [Chryseolinea sp.]